MLFQNNSKLDILYKMIGTRDEYLKTIHSASLSSKEKDILMTAHVQLAKKKQNSPVTDQAYEILFGKNAAQSVKASSQSVSHTKQTALNINNEEVIQNDSASEDQDKIELDDLYTIKD